MDSLPPRNNTSFPQALAQALGKAPKQHEILRYQQVLTLEYVVKNPSCKGLLVDHSLGTGKSIDAISIAEALIPKGFQIILLSSKSLQENFKDDILKYKKLTGKTAEEAQEELLRDYVFISTKNRATLRRLLETQSETIESPFGDEIAVESTLENKIIIVEEAHNLFNGIINGSASDVGIYDVIMKSKNVKVLFLTGTPIMNDPAEMMPCFNMLTRKELFGKSYRDFHKYFVDSKNHTIKNRNKFQNRIVGLVSHYKLPEDPKLFAKKLPTQIERVPMSPDQYAAYSAARDKEIEETIRKMGKPAARVGMAKPKGRSTTYRIRSRQISNVYYPDDAIHKTKTPYGIKEDRLLNKLELKDLKKYMPKMERIMKQINDNPKKLVVIYSQFLDAGILAAAKALRQRGYHAIKNPLDFAKKGPGYGLIYGAVEPEDRNMIIKMFGASDNKHAQHMHVLFITKTGAEGINIFNARMLFLMEPYWNPTLMNQLEGRIRRADGHKDLPQKERTVQTFIYLADYPVKFPKENIKELTTDVDIYTEARNKEKLINSFLTAIREVAIDCTTHNYENCKICAPTDLQLFVPDLDKDMKTGSPCQPIQTKKITVEEILTDAGKFYYMQDGDKIRILEERPDMGGHLEIFPDHEHYADIYEAILNKKN